MNVLLIVLFGLTAIGGLYLISYVLMNKKKPKSIAIIHGSAGIISVIILLIASFYNYSLFYALIIFLLVALGGITLFLYNINGKKAPKSLAIGHGLGAIIGFIVLIYILMQELQLMY